MALPNPVYCDVCADGTQVTSTTGSGVTAEVYFGLVPVALASQGSYVRAVSLGGAQFAVLQGADGNGYLVSNAGTIVSLGAIFGIRAVAIAVVAGALHVVWVDSAKTYTTQQFTTGLVSLAPATVTDLPTTVFGATSGILDLKDDGSPIFFDTRRTVTIHRFPLASPVQAGPYWVGLSTEFLARQVVAVEALTGKAFTLYLGQAHDPHAVLADDGSGRVHFAARTSVDGAIFVTGPPLPALAGKIPLGAEGSDVVQALYALADTKLIANNDIMSREWFDFIVRLTRQAFKDPIE